jgi:hypothetical protein
MEKSFTCFKKLGEEGIPRMRGRYSNLGGKDDSYILIRPDEVLIHMTVSRKKMIALLSAIGAIFLWALRRLIF